MRAVVQRVSNASVTVGNRIIAEINQGLLILLGLENSDTMEDLDWLCNKIVQLRIFNDKSSVMNLSVRDVGGDIIVVSQFTLHAKTKKGNRPSYIRAAHPDIAIPLYEQFISTIEKVTGKSVGSGQFGAKMEISLINDGPVTIIIDTKNKE